MNNLEKYLDQVIEQRPVVYEPPSGPPEPPPTNVLESMRKRWYVVVATVVVLCALTMPAIWLLIEPRYVVQGAVRVAPAVPNILSGESDSGGVGSYRDFVNTQAAVFVSGPVLQRIADDLKGQNLPLFSGRPQTRLEKLIARIRPAPGVVDPMTVLKNAVANETIAAAYIPFTELIRVTMKSPNPEEAKKVVDSFLRNYQALYSSQSSQQENENLSVLEQNEKELAGKIQNQRQEIRKLAEEFGTTVLDTRQDMEMSRTTQLLQELTRLEAQRYDLEARIGLLEQTEKATVSPEQLMAERREHVNSDPMVKELSTNVVQLERDLLAAQQTLTAGNPVLAQKQATMDSFKQRLDERRQELEKEFDEGQDDRLKALAEEQLISTKAQLEQIKAHEKRLGEVLNAQDTTTRKIGRTNLDLQDKQLQLKMDEEIYNRVTRRIRDIEMERQRRPRIETAYGAEVRDTEDRRFKLMAAALFMALACGFGLAFLQDKMDTTLQTPEDVTRQLDLPVLGTTTSSRTVKAALFADQISGDYQMIRTNLGLLGNGGMPRRLTISSAGMREGKTTFAVNLATSLAKSGKRVLLLDGDLRKPDVAYMLNISNGSGGVQEVLLGEDPKGFICVVPASGLHVLPANPRHLGDTYELLTSPMAAEQMERLSREYDHLIIDSPPALAFPDALVWAKLSDAVILVGFAGQTTGPELKKAKERFARIKARVLGAILNNVPLDQTLYRYGYSYRGHGGSTARKARKSKRLLLPTQSAGEHEGGTAV
jgi:succinoglycan biosynthesis transport protein ExoP